MSTLKIREEEFIILVLYRWILRNLHIYTTNLHTSEVLV